MHILPVKKEDLPVAIEILSQAFADNKSVNYVIRNDKYKMARIRELIRYVFFYAYDSGYSFKAADNTGLLLCYLPNSRKFKFNDIFLQIRLAIYSIGITRVLKVLRRESKINTIHPKTPFCYMWFMGVIESERRKGIGTALLNAAFKKCAENNIPAYGETSTLENLPLYNRVGFKIFYEFDESEYGFRLYCFRKEFPSTKH